MPEHKMIFAAFRAEGGDSMLLQNVGFYQPVHMAT
jgi:hypothetical protein